MMKMIVLLGLLGFVACGGRQEQDARPIPGSWSGQIEAVGPHGHSGFAVVALLQDGGTRANATLTRGSAGGVHPWHIHEGICSEMGPIVGDSDAYPLLRPDASGDASATVAIPVELSLDEEYSVHLHQSPDDDTLVGCGELVPSI